MNVVLLQPLVHAQHAHACAFCLQLKPTVAGAMPVKQSITACMEALRDRARMPKSERNSPGSSSRFSRARILSEREGKEGTGEKTPLS